MPPKVAKNKKLKPHGVTFSDDEKEELARYCRETGQSIAAYVRGLTAKDKANRHHFMEEISHLKNQHLPKIK